MMQQSEATDALDTIIRKARVHCYKPIHIAEILYKHRQGKIEDLTNLKSYDVKSIKWRDEISTLLVGNKSTSSQKYQLDVFNAMPPGNLAELGVANKPNGDVEAYIYNAIARKLSFVARVEQYIHNSTTTDFSIKELMKLFNTEIKTSVDKIYEIIAYVLFDAILGTLQPTVTLTLTNTDPTILLAFQKFITLILGTTSRKNTVTTQASIQRVGVANGADAGLDMITNFGPVVQTKHEALKEGLVDKITHKLCSDKIIIVCAESNKQTIEYSLLGGSVQGVVTMDDLHEWYAICLSDTYYDITGASLIKNMMSEFNKEFPSNQTLKPFMEKRGYIETKKEPPMELKVIMDNLKKRRKGIVIFDGDVF